MRIPVLLFVALLAGCVSSNESYLPDGRKGHVISCPSNRGLAGAMTNWGTCFERAGEICGAKGYQVLQRSDEPGFSVGVSQYGSSAGTTNNRMMIVRCNDGSVQAKK